MFDFDIEPEVEFVTLNYLKSLPMFGSIEWMEHGCEIMRTRAIFPLSENNQSCTKEEMIAIFAKEKMALLIETLPKAKGDNDSFCLKGVSIVG